MGISGGQDVLGHADRSRTSNPKCLLIRIHQLIGMKTILQKHGSDTAKIRFSKLSRPAGESIRVLG